MRRKYPYKPLHTAATIHIIITESQSGMCLDNAQQHKACRWAEGSDRRIGSTLRSGLAQLEHTCTGGRSWITRLREVRQNVFPGVDLLWSQAHIWYVGLMIPNVYCATMTPKPACSTISQYGNGIHLNFPSISLWILRTLICDLIFLTSPWRQPPLPLTLAGSARVIGPRKML